MKRPSLRFLASRKFWQRSAFALACLATLIAAAYAIENYRGEKAWAHYRAEAEARGEKLDFKDFIPPPIPDEENFAAIPIYRELLSRDPAVRARAGKACKLPAECISQSMQSPTDRKTPDFAALRECFIKNSVLANATGDPVADVLRALEAYEPTLAQLRTAAARTRSRLDGEWEKGFDAAIWRMGDALSLSKLVSLRASALLAKGRAHDALIDWHVGHRHAGIFQGEPTLLACMLRAALVSISADTIHGGLPAHAWSEAELKPISDDLASIDLMADFTFGLSSERAMMNGVLDKMRANSSARSAFGSGNSDKWLTLIPGGWIAQNQRHLNEWYDQEIAKTLAAQNHPASDIAPTSFEVPQSWFRFPYWFVVRSAVFMLGDNFDRLPGRADQRGPVPGGVRAGTLPSSQRRFPERTARTRSEHAAQTSARPLRRAGAALSPG